MKKIETLKEHIKFVIREYIQQVDPQNFTPRVPPPNVEAVKKSLDSKIAGTKAEGSTMVSTQNAAYLSKRFGIPSEIYLHQAGEPAPWYMVSADYGDAGIHDFKGFSWGYHGEGPRGLFAYLMSIGVPEEEANKIYNFPQESEHILSKDSTGTWKWDTESITEERRSKLNFNKEEWEEMEHKLFGNQEGNDEHRDEVISENVASRELDYGLTDAGNGSWEAWITVNGDYKNFMGQRSEAKKWLKKELSDLDIKKPDTDNIEGGMDEQMADGYATDNMEENTDKSMKWYKELNPTARNLMKKSFEKSNSGLTWKMYVLKSFEKSQKRLAESESNIQDAQINQVYDDYVELEDRLNNDERVTEADRHFMSLVAKYEEKQLSREQLLDFWTEWKRSGDSSIRIEESKKLKLKEQLKKIIKEQIVNNVHHKSSFAKYGEEIEKAIKSAIGKWASISCFKNADTKVDVSNIGNLGKIVVDDGEGGLAFTMDIIVQKRNVFSAEYTIGSNREVKLMQQVSLEDLVKWIKGDFKKAVKSLDKEEKPESKDEPIEEPKKEQTKTQLEYAEEVGKFATKKEKEDSKKEVTPAQGGKVVDKIERKVDAKDNPNKKNIAPDRKELVIKKKKDGMEVTKKAEIKQKDIKVKTPK